MSQRSCERVFRVSNKTVSKLFQEAGDMAIAYMASLKDLRIARIQADELHSFVAAKEKNLPRLHEPNEEAGTVWGFLAICADTKLVISYQVGDRDIPEARRFLAGLRAKLAQIGGVLAVRPSFVTDGMKAYEKAFDDTFGEEADYAKIVKHYSNLNKEGEPGPTSRYIGATRTQVRGHVPMVNLHTSYVERKNLNLRMQNRRYTRRSNGFSKTMLNHERHLALWAVYNNWCWKPRPVRPTKEQRAAGIDRWATRPTAAIAAGLTKKQWRVEDLLDLTDAFMAERTKLASVPSAPSPEPKPTLAQPEGDYASPFWVYHSRMRGQECKVHKASCPNCRDGQGKKAGASTYGKWLPFPTLEEAVAYAHSVDPSGESQCSMCLVGRYRTRAGLRDVQNGNPRRGTR